jgi:predicted metal-dependent peptidase
MKAEDHPLYTEVKTAMLLHVPFFASLLLDMMSVKIGKFPDVFGKRTPTAATDGKTVWFDVDFFEKLKLPERVFVMCHEIGHAMWSHMSRGKKYADTGFDGKPFNHGRWNRAGDYVINDMLHNCKVGKMPSIALHDPSKYPSKMLVDDVYRDLEDDPNDQDGDGQGEGGSMDHHIYKSDATSEVEWKRAVQTAADAAKSQGSLPAELDRFVDQLLNPKVPWVEKLRSSLTKIAGREATTWTKPHRRRLITQKVIMPSYTGFGAGHIVFVVDTSGSMSDGEIAQGLGECDNILMDCQPEAVTLIGCDAKVDAVHELYSGDSLKDGELPKLGGGGGTSFIPPFVYLEEENIRPACLVYFTDMGGSFPDDPGFPVIWCSTTEGCEGPFGETIQVELDG